MNSAVSPAHVPLGHPGEDDVGNWVLLAKVSGTSFPD